MEEFLAAQNPSTTTFTSTSTSTSTSASSAASSSSSSAASSSSRTHSFFMDAQATAQGSPIFVPSASASHTPHTSHSQLDQGCL